MRRHYLRSALLFIVMALGALALAAGVALTSGPDKAAANGQSSPFAGVKNVILFIGDGMGPNHLEVGRELSGGSLMMDDIDWGGTGRLDTSSLDGITDSAAAATALATGRETWNDWVSRGPDYPEDPDYPTIDFDTALEIAEGRGKATGLITDLELSDATPAAFAAHADSRDNADEITLEMAAQDIEALFSGGWSESSLLFGSANPLPAATKITSLKQLKPYLDSGVWPEKMYGIFGKSVLAYTIDREEEGVLRKQPTLPQLTEAAIGILEQGPQGFFVMIEAGSNDWGGHARDAAWVGAEIKELDAAVMTAYRWAEVRDDTLILVTGDHETGGLMIDRSTDYPAIAKQKASTEWMWGLIKRLGKSKVAWVLKNYAGIQVSGAEVNLIWNNKEMGISDVLADHFNVDWGWSGTDEGDYTDIEVPVMAWGPGDEAFDVSSWPTNDNENFGQLLLDAVSH